MTVLETKRLRLRVFCRDDLDAFAALEADPEVMKFYTSGPRTREHASRGVDWFIDLQERHGHSLWAIEGLVGGQFLGYCGLVPQKINDKSEIEIGYKLARAFWGQGLATEASLSVRDWGFANLDLKRFISIIDPLNSASVRVAEKIGMLYEASVDYDGKTCHVYTVSQ